MKRDRSPDTTKPAADDNASTGGPQRKRRTKILLPPPPPVQDIPPGDHPPPPDREHTEAMERHFAEAERAAVALFTLEDLGEIVAEAGAPPLGDTYLTRAILRLVSGAIWNREVAKQSQEAEKLQQRIKARRKEWLSLRKHLAVLDDAQRWQIAWFKERPWYGPEAGTFREEFLQKVVALSAAMDDLEPWLFIAPHKGRGSHGGAAIKDIPLAVQIFVWLKWAWEDAGCKPASAEKRYHIVKRCLEPTGNAASVDAVRKAINKHLREYPFHAERPESEAPKDGRK